MGKLDEIAGQITERANQKPDKSLLVAIDGHGGSGKSTIVDKLKDLLALRGIVVTVVPVDAFIVTEPVSSWQRLKDHPDAKTPYKIDIRRLQAEVLQPLSQGKPATYLFHKDWWNKEAKENRTITPTGVVITEGCYSLSKELRDYYDYKIFLDCPLDICLQRASQRDVALGGDPVTAPLFWQEIYFPAEVQYMQEQNPKAVADIVINMSGGIQ